MSNINCKHIIILSTLIYRMIRSLVVRHQCVDCCTYIATIFSALLILIINMHARWTGRKTLWLFAHTG